MHDVSYAAYKEVSSHLHAIQFFQLADSVREETFEISIGLY